MRDLDKTSSCRQLIAFRRCKAPRKEYSGFIVRTFVIRRKMYRSALFLVWRKTRKNTIEKNQTQNEVGKKTQSSREKISKLSPVFEAINLKQFKRRELYVLNLWLCRWLKEERGADKEINDLTKSRSRFFAPSIFLLAIRNWYCRTSFDQLLFAENPLMRRKIIIYVFH